MKIIYHRKAATNRPYTVEDDNYVLIKQDKLITESYTAEDSLNLIEDMCKMLNAAHFRALSDMY